MALRPRTLVKFVSTRINSRQWQRRVCCKYPDEDRSGSSRRSWMNVVEMLAKLICCANSGISAGVIFSSLTSARRYATRY